MRSVPRYEAYNKLYAVLFVVLFLGFAVAMLTYGEPFRFWDYPYSGLGATVTEHGFANKVSRAAFATDMLCISLLLLVLAVISGRDRALPNRGPRTVFPVAGSFGAAVAVFPCDVFPVQHMVGSAFLVGSLWALAIFLIIDVSSTISVRVAAWLHLLLHTTVVAYAVTYVANIAAMQVFQKIAVFGLCAVLLIASGLPVRRMRDASGESVNFRPLEG